MNSRQAFVLYVGVALETLALLFPPIRTSLVSVSGSFGWFLAEYGAEAHEFLFMWPGKSVDTGRLLCTFLLILVVTGGAVIALRNNISLPERETTSE